MSPQVFKCPVCSLAKPLEWPICKVCAFTRVSRQQRSAFAKALGMHHRGESASAFTSMNILNEKREALIAAASAKYASEKQPKERVCGPRDSQSSGLTRHQFKTLSGVTEDGRREVDIARSLGLDRSTGAIGVHLRVLARRKLISREDPLYGTGGSILYRLTDKGAAIKRRCQK